MQIKVVPPVFQFLETEHGFHVISSEVSPFFGDAEAILESSTFRLRFLRDRGDIFVEISSIHDDEWYDLNLVRLLVLQSDPSVDVSIDELAGFLEANVSVVSELFSEGAMSATRTQLMQLRQKRIKLMFPGAVEE